MTPKNNRLSHWYLRKNFSLAWPLALNALLMQSMLIIDILLVSPLGEISLAAMGIATTIIAFFLGLQIALGNGSQLIMGRMFGANDTKGQIKAIVSGFLINVMGACLFISILMLWSDDLIKLLAPDPLLANSVHQYLAISQFILLASAFTQMMIVFFNAQGNTKIPFQAYLIELPFNTIVSYFLIFGITLFSFDGLGVAGAAFGSLASVLLRFSFLLIRLRKSPLFKKWHIIAQTQSSDIIQHFKAILPIATNFLILSVGTTIYLLLFSQLDIYSYVAVTLIFPWIRIATQLIVAWAQANAISITQAIGKGKISHITPIIESCIKLGVILSVVVAVALYIFSLCLTLVYPKIEQQTLLALASIMPLYVALPLLRTYNTIAGNLLRALGQSVAVLKVHFIAQWLVFLPLFSLFVLVFEWSLFWVFALIPFEEAIKIIPFRKMLSEAQQVNKSQEINEAQEINKAQQK